MTDLHKRHASSSYRLAKLTVAVIATLGVLSIPFLSSLLFDEKGQGPIKLNSKTQEVLEKAIVAPDDMRLYIEKSELLYEGPSADTLLVRLPLDNSTFFIPFDWLSKYKTLTTFATEQYLYMSKVEIEYNGSKFNANALCFVVSEILCVPAFTKV